MECIWFRMWFSGGMREHYYETWGSVEQIFRSEQGLSHKEAVCLF